MVNNIDYYVPTTAWKVREFLDSVYPRNKAKHRRMRKNQLYAVYHSVMKKHGGSTIV